MPSPFPEEAVNYINESLQRNLKDTKDWSDQHFRIFAAYVYQASRDERYGFRDALRTGHYVNYSHEEHKYQVYHQNCTTIIPPLYIVAELLGYHPHIVQFQGFRDIQSTDEKKEPSNSSTHFSLIVDLGRKQPYLVDPFWDIFGPILLQDDHRIRVGRTNRFRGRTREFTTCTPYASEAFAAMLNHLRDPAGSLDMLAAGQRLHQGHSYKGIDYDQTLFYHPEQNSLTSRLYASYQLISDKAIIAHMPLDDHGNVKKTTIDLFFAENATWSELINAKKFATTDPSTLHTFRTLLRKLSPDKNSRLGPHLLRNPSLPLTELADLLLQTTDTAIIQKQLIARTLYEGLSPQKQYHTTPEEHDAYLLSFINEERRLREEGRPLAELFYDLDWKLRKIDKNEKRKLRHKKRTLARQATKVVEKINFLNDLRRENKPAFHQLIDQVLFAEKYKDHSPTDLEDELKQASLDMRIGYLTILSDFLPLFFYVREELLLKQFMPSIQEKVTARYHPTLPFEALAQDSSVR